MELETFPKNFTLLHQGEECIRARSLEAIHASESMPHHFELVADSMDLIDYFARHFVHTSEEQLLIQHLGIRLFNGSASAVQLMLSGYYQTAVLQQRDLLEVVFLLDYFQTNRAMIAEWKTCDEGSRNKRFGAFHVRKALDDRDGFTERKREAHYKLLCSLGGHESFQGLRMLRPIDGSDAHCGLFFAEPSLIATVEELTKIMVQAASAFTRFFDAKSRADYVAKLTFMEKQGVWFERFFGRPFDRQPLDEMRARILAINSVN
jgi:hypothetical protein